MNIQNKTILITGANRGIGRALVTEALRRGAKRIYAGTRSGELQNADSRVTPLTLDVTNTAQIQAAVEKVESLDILINNAGLALYDDLSDRAALEQSLAINLYGPYGVTQAFLPLLTGSRAPLLAFCRCRPLPPCHSLRPTRSQRRPRSPCHNRCALFWPDGALRYMWSCPARWTRI